MPNAALVNFASGETSQQSRGRFDLAFFTSSCRKLVNFVAEITGAARYRSGFRYLSDTRGGKKARLIPFQLNDAQTYMLEFTPGFMRVYKNTVLITSDRTTITAATNANPIVVTVTSTTDLVDDDEIIITDIVGMEELNGRQVKLANKSGSTYELVDPTTGVGIDSTSWGVYVSGGTLVEIDEIATPYAADDLDEISYAQDHDTMYIAHFRHAPRKITVAFSGFLGFEETFTLAQYAITNNPFVNGPAIDIDNITQAAEAVITFAAGSQIDTRANYEINGVTGMTEVNGLPFRFEPTGLSDLDAFLVDITTGLRVDSTGFTAYVAGGGDTATPLNDRPRAVTFYESRLVFLGTLLRPSTMFFSRSPDSAGAPRYDDFTGGSSVLDAVFFSLAPVNGVVEFITWGIGTPKYLLVGTFGGAFRVSGGGVDIPISIEDINVKQIDAYGCSAAFPARSTRIFFLQRNGETVRTISYNSDLDDFISSNMCLNAEQIPVTGLDGIIFRAGTPDALWVRRGDGTLASMTLQEDERVAGWHRHQLGGTDTFVSDIQVLSQLSGKDQVWVVVARTVDGNTRRTVERLADAPVFKDEEDFFSGSANETADKTNFLDSTYRRQEEYIHVDSALTYNGSDRGAIAAATLTPGATTGTSITFTSSTPVFLVGDIGNALWKKPAAADGVGSGRATITGFTDASNVVCTITEDFDSTNAIAAGVWQIAVDELNGLWSLEGEQVAVVADGDAIKTGRETGGDIETISEGSLSLASVAAVVHVGLPYEGLLQTQNLEIGGRSGPAQAKPRNIVELFIRFLNSLGCEYGTDLYRTQLVVHDDHPTDPTTRPQPTFSGIKKLQHSDDWEAEGEKKVVVLQRTPLPCIIQFVDIRFQTGDEDGD